jgi:toxin YoeB
MRLISFDPDAFEQYNSWALVDKKLFVRIQRLIIESSTEPFVGIGKPEPLKGNLRGYWSRRITDEHRLVYKVTDDMIIIASCKFHYTE